MKPKFRVVGSFELASRGLFVVFGDIVHGELLAGMSIGVEVGPNLSVVGRIASVEFVDFRSAGAGYVALTLEHDDPSELDVWRSLIEEGTELLVVDEDDHAG